MSAPAAVIGKRARGDKVRGTLFYVLLLVSVSVGFVLLGTLIVDVIRKGMALGVPFELTLSCMQPANGKHCGRCSKCRERREAFVAAGVADPARY